MIKKFTVIAKKWFDKVNGNTYHSVRCIRHRDGKVIVGQFQYGYGESYKQTTFHEMFKAKWLPRKYKPYSYKSNTGKTTGAGNLYAYERENNYPIIWDVSVGLKRDCVANGIE